MPKYKKKQILVTAEIADKNQFIVTLEGITEAKAGDYIVTGVDNEQWALKPQWFSLAYTHVEGNTYKRKPQVLTAHKIDEAEYTTTPNGPIRGDKGDYRVTGTEGEHWYVKPDIFAKTYEEVRKSMYELSNPHMLNKGHISNATGLQKAIDQIGMDAVIKSLGSGVALGYCDVHGHYAVPMRESTGDNELPIEGCTLCPPNLANGTSATEVELYIDLNPEQALGTNPHQKVMNVTEGKHGIEHVAPTVEPSSPSHIHYSK